MMPGGGSSGQMGPGREPWTRSLPPYWSPQTESSYAFRAYLTDLQLWIMLTDMQPHQQAAAIVLRLGGAAREVARQITPQELMQGGIRNGVQLDPVTYIMAALHTRFAQLEDESRTTAMLEMKTFHRRHNEDISSLLARYETVRQRAAIEGQFVQSIEACTLQLFQVIGVTPQTSLMLLQPFDYKYPTNEEQFSRLITTIIRQYRIMENHPGNITQALNPRFQGQRPGYFLTDIADGRVQQSGSEAIQPQIGGGSFGSDSWPIIETNPGLQPTQPTEHHSFMMHQVPDPNAFSTPYRRLRAVSRSPSRTWRFSVPS